MKVNAGDHSFVLPERVILVSSVIWMTGVSASRMMTAVNRSTILAWRSGKGNPSYGEIYFSSDPQEGRIVEFFPAFPSDGEVEIVTHVIRRF